jgi:predicted dehydrogenase
MGVIGCGAIAQIMHIPYLAEYEQFDLVALADVHQPTLDDVAGRYQAQRRYTDPFELIAQDDLDAVVICHSGSHRDTIIAALDAGKHVFVEKPMTWIAREAREVAEHVKSGQRILQVGYHKLYDPAFAYVKEQLDKMQDLGVARITVLHPANELGFSPHRIRRGDGVIQEGHVDVGDWEGQRNRQVSGMAGGEIGALVDEALGESRKDDDRLRLAYGIITGSLIHQVYALYGFLGEPKRVISTDIFREGFSIHTVIEYRDNLHVTMDWHFLSHLKDYHEEYAFLGNFDRVYLRFPSPYFRNFPSPVTVQGCEGELMWEKRIIVNYEEAFQRELIAFYENVQSNTQPELSSIKDGVKHQEFIQQIIDAAV